MYPERKLIVKLGVDNFSRQTSTLTTTQLFFSCKLLIRVYVRVRGRSDDGQVSIKSQKFSALVINGRETCEYNCNVKRRKLLRFDLDLASSNL